MRPAALVLTLSAALGCRGELPPPPDAVSAATGTSAGGAGSEPADTAQGDTVPWDTASSPSCEEAKLDLEISFEHSENPTLATVTARIAGGYPSAISVSYSEGGFSYQLSLEPEQVLTGDSLRWLHPFPDGAQGSLALELTEGETRICQTVALDVPEVKPDQLPTLTSTWSYEVWPRPAVMAIPVTLQRPNWGPEDRIIVIDQQGRYLWQYSYSAERALPTPEGVMVLPRGLGGELELIHWDGRIEGLALSAEGYHHDFAYDERDDTLYALFDERVEEWEEACGLEAVYGDRLVGGGEDLWRTSTDYIEGYPHCSQITEQSISYLNGLSLHDGLLSSSSSPMSPPHGIVVGWRVGEEWDFLKLLTADENSDIPVTYEGSCAKIYAGAAGGTEVSAVPSFASSPHSVSCEATRWEDGQGELNCFLHNRRRTRECDSLEWVRITIEGSQRTASCVASTAAHGTPMGETLCGDWSFRGNVELLDGHTDDPGGAYAVEFSPGNTFITGARLFGGAEPRIERAFVLYDPNTDTSARGLEERGCLDDSKPCTTSGIFVTPRLGLGDRWAVSR